MSQPIIHTTGKLQDSQIVGLTDRIEAEFGPARVSFLYGQRGIPVEEARDNFSKASTYSLTGSDIQTKDNTFHVRYRRGTTGFNNHNVPEPNVRIASPYYDEIIVVIGDGRNNTEEPDTNQIVKLEEIIAEFVSAKVPKAIEAGSKNVIGVLEKEIADLAALHRQMVANAEEQRQRLQKELEDRSLELERKAAQQKQKVEEYSTAEAAKIQLLRDELEEAQKRVDDRDHMYVRRELREKITSEIGNRVAGSLLPTRVNVAKWAVFAFSLFCAVVSAWLAFYSYNALSELTMITSTEQSPGPANMDWLITMAVIRATVTSIATLGFLVYGLTWLRKSYSESVDITNELQRYSLDINRASWIIETIMEMTGKEGRVLPTEWIVGACYGLFRGGGAQSEEVRPIEALGALLGVSGKAEIGPDGPKFEIQKGQLKRMAQDARDH